MIIVYAIKSLSRHFIYVGLTNNLDRRIEEHNKGYNKSTKPYIPFELIYSKSFPDRKQARHHEKELKTTTGRRMLHKL